MIIGNGLIANSIREIDNSNCCFFCSGVSDSTQVKSSEFQREIDFLLNQDKSKKLIYFSTISVFNPNKQNSLYIIHKKNVEQIIAQHFYDYCIVRLPNMVGPGGNATNLIPYIRSVLKNNLPFVVFENAHRHLMDVQDLKYFLPAIIESNIKQINACYSNPPFVLDVYLYLCELMQKTPRYTIGGHEELFEIENTDFEKIIVNNTNVFSDWKLILNNYKY